MNESNKTFRDKLLDVEKPNATYKEKYEKEVSAMFEKKLTFFGRLIYALLGVIALGWGLWYGVAGILGLMELPVSARIVFTILAIICLSFAVLAGWTAKNGTIKLKLQPPAITCMIWAFVVVMLMGLMAKGIRQAEPIWAIQAVVYGSVFLIVTSLLMIVNRIQQSEYNTREKLLEIEYRLAELAEKIKGKPEK